MQKLNLPDYDFKWKEVSGKKMIFDPFRAKYIVLTPEEYVRQVFARFLNAERGFPASLMMTEYGLKMNEMQKRCDIIAFNRNGNPLVLVECKAPSININQKVFDQIARYNVVFRVKYLVVTNGLKHYCCTVDFETGEIKFLEDIPRFSEIS